MRKSWSVMLLIASVFLAGYFAVSLFNRIAFRSSDLRFTQSVQWEESEVNSILLATIHFQNESDGPIEITDIQTTCGCIVLGFTEEEKTAKLSNFTLSARSQKDVSISVTNRGVPGEMLRHIVSFDASRYPGQRFQTELLVKKVIGNIVSAPPAISIPDAVLGQKTTVVVNIIDKAAQNRELNSVDCSIPCVTIEKIEKVNIPIETVGANSRIIARVHVSFTPDRLESHGGFIECSIGNLGYRHKIDFSANVTGLVVVRPSYVILPRSTTDGDDYETKIVVSCQSSRKLEFVSMDLPMNFTYALVNEPNRDNEIVATISYRRKSQYTEYPLKLSGLFRCKVDGDIHETPLQLRVLR